jgi:hypothetical protein
MSDISVVLMVVGIATALVVVLKLLVAISRLEQRMYFRGAPAPIEPVQLPVVDAARKCGSCAHFDLEAGQLALQRRPVFAGFVAPYIAPHEYHDTVKATDDAGAPAQVVVKSNVPMRCNWKDFGQCTRHDDGVWREMTAEQRLKNFEDWTSEGDCYEART